MVAILSAVAWGQCSRRDSACFTGLCVSSLEALMVVPIGVRCAPSYWARKPRPLGWSPLWVCPRGLPQSEVKHNLFWLWNIPPEHVLKFINMLDMWSSKSLSVFQARVSTTTTTPSHSTTQPASWAWSSTLPPGSLTSCFGWGWSLTANRLRRKWSKLARKGLEMAALEKQRLAVTVLSYTWVGGCVPAHMPVVDFFSSG